MLNGLHRSLVAIVYISSPCLLWGQTSQRTLDYSEYLDKVHGGWAGKAIGLIMGVPNEYDEPWPPSDFDYYAEVPTHFSDQYSGDDFYVPLVNQLALKKHGIHATPQQYLQEWSLRLYSGRVWVSTEHALDLYHAGIQPPQTGHPGFNAFWNDMMAQISQDNFGWISPGMINTAAALADNCSHVTNWGIGADAGVFTAALLSEAFFTSDPETLVRKARAVLPPGSEYGEMVDDALRLRQEQPDWRMTRQILAKKYNRNLDPGDPTVIAATGIGTVVGLLYGEGDFGKSMIIAQKARWDSDCTASTVAGIMGTLLGYSRIDTRWTGPVHDSYENYCVKGLPRWMTFTDIARDSVELGQKVIVENGGSVTGSGAQRKFSIQLQPPRALTRREMVTPELVSQGEQAVARHFLEKCRGVTASWDSRWTLTRASFETPPEVLPSYMNRPHVLKAPPGPKGAILEGQVRLSAEKHHFLKIGVAHHPRTYCDATGQLEHGTWRLEVQVNGEKIGEYNVKTQGGTVVWEDPQFDLSRFAGQTVTITLIALQEASEFNRSRSTSYWSGITLLSMDELEPWR